jgi:hypothetical protein
MFANSVNADVLYLLRVEFYSRGIDEDEYDYHFYVKCRVCNSLIKITTEEAKEILNNCGYECDYYRWRNQLNVLETAWKNDYPNNFKEIEFYSRYNPNDIFNLKVELNISDDIVSNLDNARKYLNNIRIILNDNIADRKCHEAHYELQHILNEYDSLEKKIKTIINKEE